RLREGRARGVPRHRRGEAHARSGPHAAEDDLQADRRHGQGLRPGEPRGVRPGLPDQEALKPAKNAKRRAKRTASNESMKANLRLAAALLSFLLLSAGIGAWHLATLPSGGQVVVDPEYAKLVGAQAARGEKSAFPTPADFGGKLWRHLADPVYDHGPNDKGIGLQLG